MRPRRSCRDQGCEGLEVNQNKKGLYQQSKSPFFRIKEVGVNPLLLQIYVLQLWHPVSLLEQLDIHKILYGI